MLNERRELTPTAAAYGVRKPQSDEFTIAAIRHFLVFGLFSESRRKKTEVFPGRPSYMRAGRVRKPQFDKSQIRKIHQIAVFGLRGPQIHRIRQIAVFGLHMEKALAFCHHLVIRRRLDMRYEQPIIRYPAAGSAAH